MDRMLPVHHFMTTCTVPAEFRDVFRSHQNFAYSSLFQATSMTISSLAAEPTYFPGDTPGFFGVLHTWGRQMQYHPHIHYIIPGGDGIRSVRYLSSYVFRSAISSHRVINMENRRILF